MLNPNEQFVVLSFARKHVADLFNDVIDERGLNIIPFTPDDERLTCEVCQEVASGWIVTLEDNNEDDQVEAAGELLMDVLNKHVDL